jgi:hypothetical protein
MNKKDLPRGRFSLREHARAGPSTNGEKGHCSAIERSAQVVSEF